MNRLITCVIICLLALPTAYSQTINELINKVNLDSLELRLNEFTGEIPTLVNGNSVSILNRQSNMNDVAADYLIQEFSQFDNLTITDQAYNANGRNIIATQLGMTNPNQIIIVSAHYDSVADYCADDNASGVVAILEIARILSTQCMENTIVYALWDQEENGLIGSNYYATQAANNGSNILGVLNIDMMGYDGDDDNDFDIDVRNIANSIAMKDDIISVLNTPEYGFNLNVNVVNPGTTASDHSRFWNNGYSAVLVGEAWSNNDETPYYHSSGDRFSTLNLPYYHELTKLIMAYMATSAGLMDIDNSVTSTGVILTANQGAAVYQWYQCSDHSPIAGATNQSFSPMENGSYAVEVTMGNCIETSDCFTVETLGFGTFELNAISIFPNPMKTEFTIEASFDEMAKVELYDIAGKLIWKKQMEGKTSTFSVKELSKGLYLLKITTTSKTGTFQLVKE